MKDSYNIIEKIKLIEYLYVSYTDEILDFDELVNEYIKLKLKNIKG